MTFQYFIQIHFVTGPVHFLILARKVDIRRISLDTPDLTDVVMPVSGLRHAVAIDFDPVNKCVHWSDDEMLEIKKSKMDGTGIGTLLCHCVAQYAFRCRANLMIRFQQNMILQQYTM